MARRKGEWLDSRKNMSGVLYTVRRPSAYECDVQPRLNKRKEERGGLFLPFSAVLEKAKNFIIQRQSKKLAALDQVSRRAKNGKQRTVNAGESPTAVQQISERETVGRKRQTVLYRSLACAVGVCMVVVVAVAAGVFSQKETKVIINDAGRIVYANTTEETVGEVLSKNGIALNDGDILEVSLSAAVEEDMEIVIRRANNIAINVDGTTNQITMVAGTVAEALERAGIAVDSDDEVYPSPDTFIYAGMNIDIVRVDVQYETKTEAIAYKTVTKESEKFEKGKKVLMQEGANGQQESTVKVVYKNGEEYARETLETVVTVEPVDEIIYIGTYVKPEPTKTPANNKTNNKTDSGNASTPSYATDDSGKLQSAPSVDELHNGTWSQHASAPAPASNIISRTITATAVTAYTHTGNRTATGTWPRIGTLAANPKQLPYGTKLYIPGYGYGRVEDTGSNKHSLDEIHIDVFLETLSECRQWGRKRNLTVYVLNG